MGSICILIEGEAGKSHYVFWEHINKHIYNGKLTLISCNGIFGVESTFNKYYNTDNLFILDIDNVIDNKVVTESLLNINSTILTKYQNVYNLGLTCFEDTLLSFIYLVPWVFSKEALQEAVTVPKCMYLDAYKEFGEAWRLSALLSSRMVEKFKSRADTNGNVNLAELSTEQLAYGVLNRITMSTGFKSNKGNLGECFCNICKSDSCAVVKNTYLPLNRRCGLWRLEEAKLAKDKAIELCKHTKLNQAMKECRAYFLKHDFVLAKEIKVY